MFKWLTTLSVGLIPSRKVRDPRQKRSSGCETKVYLMVKTPETVLPPLISQHPPSPTSKLHWTISWFSWDLFHHYLSSFLNNILLLKATFFFLFVCATPIRPRSFLNSISHSFADSLTEVDFFILQVAPINALSIDLFMVLLYFVKEERYLDTE